MAGAETYGVDTWLYQTLTGGTALTALVGTRVYNEVVPQNAEYPYVVFNYVGGSDSVGVNQARIFTRGTWNVKGVDQLEPPLTSAERVAAIAEAIDGLLQKASGTVTGTRVYACSRQSQFRLTDVQDGLVYRQMGGTYRIVAQ